MSTLPTQVLGFDDIRAMVSGNQKLGNSESKCRRTSCSEIALSQSCGTRTAYGRCPHFLIGQVGERQVSNVGVRQERVPQFHQGAQLVTTFNEVLGGNRDSDVPDGIDSGDALVRQKLSDAACAWGRLRFWDSELPKLLLTLQQIRLPPISTLKARYR